jgi:hypothetical protein
MRQQPSRHGSPDHFSVDVGEAIIAALVADGQAGMVKT